MRIGIIVSGSGHMDEALTVIEAFKGHDIFLVTYYQEGQRNFSYPGIKNVYSIKLWGNGSIGFKFVLSSFINIFELIFILMKERPKALFSTGSEIAIVPFFVGKYILRAKLIFLETVTRVIQPSGTAKILYPIVDLFLVQWESLIKNLGPKALFRGRIV